MKKLFFLVCAALLFSGAYAQLTNLPVNFNEEKLAGHWEFKTQATVFDATVGPDLNPTNLVPEDWQEVDGIPTLRINKPESNANSDSRGLVITHGMEANGESTTHVRKYAMMFDIKLDEGPDGGQNLISLFRPTATGDGRAFIGFDTKRLGLTQYLQNAVLLGEWNRIILNIDLEANIYDMYAIHPNGDIKVQKPTQRTDLALGIDSPLDFFGDEDGENGRLNVSQIALFNDFLSDEDLEGLGVITFLSEPTRLSFNNVQIGTVQGVVKTATIKIPFSAIGTPVTAKIEIEDNYLFIDGPNMVENTGELTAFFIPQELGDYSNNIIVTMGERQIIIPVTGRGVVNSPIEANEWYRIQFSKRTKNFLTDMGEGEVIEATPYDSGEENQLWKFEVVGEVDGIKSYKLINKSGRSLTYRPEEKDPEGEVTVAGRFLASETSDYTFKITPRPSDIDWQIFWNEFTSSTGTKGTYLDKSNTDTEVGQYDANPSDGTAILFYKENEVITDGKPLFFDEDDENPQWYFIQFRRTLDYGKNYGIMTSEELETEESSKLQQVQIEKNNRLMYWKLIGTEDEFRVVDINGNEWGLGAEKVCITVDPIEGNGSIFQLEEYTVAKTWSMKNISSEEYINDTARKNVGEYSLDGGGAILFIPVEPAVGINNPNEALTEDPIVSTVYYTLEGILIGNTLPQANGIYIEKNTHASQKVSAKKLSVTTKK